MAKKKKTAKKKAATGRKRASVKARTSPSKKMMRGIFRGDGCE